MSNQKKINYELINKRMNEIHLICDKILYEIEEYLNPNNIVSNINKTNDSVMNKTNDSDSDSDNENEKKINLNQNDKLNNLPKKLNKNK